MKSFFLGTITGIFFQGLATYSLIKREFLVVRWQKMLNQPAPQQMTGKLYRQLGWYQDLPPITLECENTTFAQELPAQSVQRFSLANCRAGGMISVWANTEAALVHDNVVLATGQSFQTKIPPLEPVIELQTSDQKIYSMQIRIN